MARRRLAGARLGAQRRDAHQAHQPLNPLPCVNLAGVNLVALARSVALACSRTKAIFAWGTASIFRLVLFLIRRSLRNGSESN